MQTTLELPDIINAISTDNQKERSCLIQVISDLGKAMNMKPLTTNQLDEFCDMSIERLEVFIEQGENAYRLYLTYKRF